MLIPPRRAAYPPAFFARDPVQVARELLGSVLVRTLEDDRVLAGRVVEAEAYDCPRDPSCSAGRFHAARSQALAAPPGTFVFWVAHTHPLLQLSCREAGVAASVLLRALEPLAGVAAMLEHRPVVDPHNLTSGPAKLVRALHVTPDFRGQPSDGEARYLAPGEPVANERVSVTSRVGIAAGQHLPWRFLETGSPWLSGGRPSMELP
ncbi:MAG: DNA-3-methyladenine glycosylase [Deinococcus sp.]